MKKLFVLDASAYLYSSYFAIRNMTNNKGESTNALFGFIRSILKIMKDFNPEHFVVVFDGPRGKIKRTKIYSEYKANRSAMPDDLRYQMDWAQQFCDLMGLPKLVIPEVEADDTMGSIAKWAGSNQIEVFLCTKDKDLAQLVNGHVKILNTFKDNLLLDHDKVEEVYGVPPEKIIDLLAITGDSSDNVPGLPGFGPKTAISLLQNLGSLDNILASPDKVPGKKKQETIVNEREKALLSRELVTIITNVEIPKTDQFFELKTPESEALAQFLTAMNFSSLLKELQVSKESEKQNAYTLIDDEASFQKLLKLLMKQKEICFDTETTSVKPMQADLVGIGFSIKQNEAWYVPTNGELGLKRVIDGVKPLFENPKIGFYGHNVKYDLHVIANYDIQIKNICFDTILASYILNSQSRQHSLDNLALTLFGKVKVALTDLIGKGKNQITMMDVPIETASNYCCEDVDYTYRLKQKFNEELKERKLTKLFYNIELPLLTILAKMERHGIYLDTPKLKEMGEKVVKEIDRLEKEIHSLAGSSFNVKSPRQVEEAFLKLGIKLTKKTTTGFSTNAAVLEELKEAYPIAASVLDYRTVEKLRSTYIDTLPSEVNPKTERIHPTFNQSVAATGRLSCQDPNLQNIPIRTELGREVRAAFRPEKKGWSYLAADYSQIELRLVAHLSEDPTLLQAFQNGEDIHTHTAATILGIPLKEVTKEQRYQAKAVNFGIIYGQQAFGLARETGVSFEEASNFIKTYFQRYSRVKEFIEACKEEARKTGKAVTITGRERAIPEINSKNGQIRAAAERLAINTPLQGTAADLIKMAMIKIDQVLEKDQKLGFMILQIHDELIFEIPDFEIMDFNPLVKNNMEKVLKLKVPLIVDINVGKNWKEC